MSCKSTWKAGLDDDPEPGDLYSSGQHTRLVGCEDILKIDKRLALFVGGTRSGKSDLAEAWLARYGQEATYLATLGGDDGGDARVARHRARRPAWLSTVELEEGSDLPALVAAARTPLLIDSLGTWLVRFEDFRAPRQDFLDSLQDAKVPVAVVAELVGEGIHPPDGLSRSFVDAQGELTSAIRAIADEAYLVVAGACIALVEPNWAGS